MRAFRGVPTPITPSIAKRRWVSRSAERRKIPEICAPPPLLTRIFASCSALATASILTARCFPGAPTQLALTLPSLWCCAAAVSTAPGDRIPALMATILLQSFPRTHQQKHPYPQTLRPKHLCQATRQLKLHCQQIHRRRRRFLPTRQLKLRCQQTRPRRRPFLPTRQLKLRCQQTRRRKLHCLQTHRLKLRFLQTHRPRRRFLPTRQRPLRRQPSHGRSAGRTATKSFQSSSQASRIPAESGEASKACAQPVNRSQLHRDSPAHGIRLCRRACGVLSAPLAAAARARYGT